METQYLSLEALAATLGLPQKYLKDLAKSNEIPCLDVNGRLRFDPNRVRKALDRIASLKQRGNHAR